MKPSAQLRKRRNAQKAAPSSQSPLRSGNAATHNNTRNSDGAQAEGVQSTWSKIPNSAISPRTTKSSSKLERRDLIIFVCASFLLLLYLQSRYLESLDMSIGFFESKNDMATMIARYIDSGGEASVGSKCSLTIENWTLDDANWDHSGELIMALNDHGTCKSVQSNPVWTFSYFEMHRPYVKRKLLPHGTMRPSRFLAWPDESKDADSNQKQKPFCPSVRALHVLGDDASITESTPSDDGMSTAKGDRTSNMIALVCHPLKLVMVDSTSSLFFTPIFTPPKSPHALAAIDDTIRPLSVLWSLDLKPLLFAQQLGDDEDQPNVEVVDDDTMNERIQEIALTNSPSQLIVSVRMHRTLLTVNADIRTGNLRWQHTADTSVDDQVDGSLFHPSQYNGSGQTSNSQNGKEQKASLFSEFQHVKHKAAIGSELPHHWSGPQDMTVATSLYDSSYLAFAAGTRSNHTGFGSALRMAVSPSRFRTSYAKRNTSSDVSQMNAVVVHHRDGIHVLDLITGRQRAHVRLPASPAVTYIDLQREGTIKQIIVGGHVGSGDDHINTKAHKSSLDKTDDLPTQTQHVIASLGPCEAMLVEGHPITREVRKVDPCHGAVPSANAAEAAKDERSQSERAGAKAGQGGREGLDMGSRGSGAHSFVPWSSAEVLTPVITTRSSGYLQQQSDALMIFLSDSGYLTALHEDGSIAWEAHTLCAWDGRRVRHSNFRPRGLALVQLAHRREHFILSSQELTEDLLLLWGEAYVEIWNLHGTRMVQHDLPCVPSGGYALADLDGNGWRDLVLQCDTHIVGLMIDHRPEQRVLAVFVFLAWLVGLLALLTDVIGENNAFDRLINRMTVPPLPNS
eukprot:Clim_evm11s77 gene=Clim_evmTU11s77